MAAVTTVRDVLYHYTFARGLYERLIGDCDCHPQVARNVVALLIWLDQGTNKVISHLPSMSTTALGHLLNEASCVIHCLRMRNLPGPPTPLLSALCQDSNMDDSRFFAFNQGRIARGVADLLDGVCTLIFDDRLYHLLRWEKIACSLAAPTLPADPIPIPSMWRSVESNARACPWEPSARAAGTARPHQIFLPAPPPDRPCRPQPGARGAL